MRLQSKVLLLMLSVVTLCLLAVAWWSVRSASQTVHSTARLYLRGVLSTYEKQVLMPQFQLLKRNGLDKVTSFVRKYQDEAAALVTEIPLLWPGHVFIFDAAEHKVVLPGGHDDAKQYGSWKGTVAALQENGLSEGSGHHASPEGRDYYYAVHFAPWDWYVIASVKDAALNAGMNEILAGAAMAGLVAVILLAVIMTFLFRRVFLIPMRHLRRAAKEIAAHNFVEEIPVVSQDELGGLARDMERMSRDLQEGRRRLVQWNEELERKVEKRTNELARQNDMLHQEMAERKSAQASLAETLSLYRFLVEGTSDLVTLVDDKGDFLFVNPTGRIIYGEDPDDLMGRNAFDFIHPEDRERTQRAFTGWMERKERRVTFENRNISKTGEARDLLWAISLEFDAHGRIQHIASIAKDVTDAKRAERHLQAYSEQLERSNREIKSFAYIVSHDLRAPLVNLKGFVSELGFSLEDVSRISASLVEKLDQGDRETLRLALEEDIPEAMGFINAAVGRMDMLIESILKLSRLGRLEFDLETLDVNRIVSGLKDDLSHQLSELGARIEMGPLPTITADRTSMEQIFANIMGNAVKYLDPERPGVVRVMGRRLEDHTEFRVEDNGQGIAKENLDRIFEPFRRVGSLKVPGEGMGLAYVQTLVRRYGGSIWCESEPGQGSTFVFTIPHAVPIKEN